MALRNSAAHGYRSIEYAYLRHQRFNPDRRARLARSLNVEIGVTMGLPLDKDISSKDPASVSADTAMQADGCHAARAIGGNKLGGTLCSARARHDRRPTRKGRDTSAADMAKTAVVAGEVRSQGIVPGGSVAALYPMVSARVATHMTNRQAADFPEPMIVVDEAAEYGAAFGLAGLLHRRFLSVESDAMDAALVPGPDESLPA